MAMFQALRLIPGGELFGLENETYLILGFGAIGLLAFLLPLIDRRVVREGRSPLVTGRRASAVLPVGFTAIG
jgi:hypothetical protein